MTEDEEGKTNVIGNTTSSVCKSTGRDSNLVYEEDKITDLLLSKIDENADSDSGCEDDTTAN